MVRTRSNRPRLSTLRVAWLVSGLAVRRKVNRLTAMIRRKRPPTGRAGTAPKKRGGGILLGVLSLIFLFQATTMSAGIVHRVAVAAERRGNGATGIAMVDAVTMDWVAWADYYWGGQAHPHRQDWQPDWRQKLDKAFEWQAHLEGIRDETTVRERADELDALFEARGSRAFRASQVQGSSILPTAGAWYGGADSREMLTPLALIAFLLAMSVGLLGIAGPDQELAKVESSFEWWFTFPVPARGLFVSRVLETALVNPLSWLVLCPFLSVVFWCAGHSWLGIPMGIFATLYVGLLVGGVRAVVETGLRRFLSLRAVARVQAALLLIAYATFVVAMAAVSPDGLETLGKGARHLPSWVLLNALNLPIAMVAGGSRALWVGAVCALGALVAVAGGATLGGWMMRDGLAKTTGVESAGRLQVPRNRPPWVGSGVFHKEFALLRRDRTLFMQTIVVPATLLGFQLLINRGLGSELAAHARHAVAVAFGVGALVLSTGACSTLALDVPILWIYFTVPRSLERLLIDKALFWSGVAITITVSTFMVLLRVHPATILSAAPMLGLAIAGVVLNAFVATAIGMLGTDPIETEPRRRVRVAMVYLYMLIAGMFTYALYVPSLWAKFTQVVLSTLLAFALWQKVRDHAPFLLDPAAAPPPTIAVADGVIVALAFFVLQGVLALLLWNMDFSPGAGILFAFVGAGLTVTACTVFIFWRTHLPRLAYQLGLRPSSAGWARSAIGGVLGGLAAATVARGYLLVVDHVDLLRRLRDETVGLSQEDRSASMIRWIALLAIFAAPLFEEFIFRAVLYGGFRRSLGPARAAFASALVFAIVHPAIACFPVFVLGLVAAWSYERSRFLLAPALAHMTYNAATVGLAIWWL